MKKALLCLVLISTFLTANTLKTNHNYKEALTLAKEENKLILFMASIESCPVCDYMKDIVLEREQIISYLNQNYIVVIKDIEKEHYPIRFVTIDVPTFSFIDPHTHKEVHTKKIGGAKPEKFLEILTLAKEGENNQTITSIKETHVQ
ncbi:MAG: DUF255 domain-containing protein [Epsilonproteobacteria bacterium]|nr:DUF255 domain-containing protein [Campylobacterota bacterium]